jgi:hypothetical protein
LLVEAKLTPPGLAFSAATRSLSDLNGDAAPTTSTFGVFTTSVTGSKSV